jgi:transcriptional regulator with XRE-family HTH domain
MASTRETYGGMVARLRIERGWTQRELSERSGVPLRTLQDIEGDQHNARGPQRKTRLALATALEIEGNPEQAGGELPADVRLILDIIATFLMQLTEAERSVWLREMTERQMELREKRARNNP